MNKKNRDELLADDNRKIIVLDDDPTGSQTVHGVPLFLEFNREILEKAINDDNIKAFYVLTNTRAMDEEETSTINKYLSRLVDELCSTAGIDYEIISRGDSTLRGHFPLELDVIRDNITKNIDGYILIPFFGEGGRVTKNDIHYIKSGEEFLPVGKTQFSKDHIFGYKSSNLIDYVDEKYKGKINHSDIKSISLEALRDNPNEAYNILLELDNQVCIVNAENYEDVNKFVELLIRAENNGKNFLIRSAASYVKSRIRLKYKPLLKKSDLGITDNRGGLIVVGSYVDMTTSQLEELNKIDAIEKIIIDVDKILSSGNDYSYINISRVIDENTKNGIDTVISTSRKVILNKDEMSFIEVGKRVSDYLANIVKNLEEKPGFIISKGGITSHDIARKGLNIKKVIVQGQIIDGVTVWITDNDSKFENLVYVVFPGNVGDKEDLKNVLFKLKGNE